MSQPDPTPSFLVPAPDLGQPRDSGPPPRPASAPRGIDPTLAGVAVGIAILLLGSGFAFGIWTLTDLDQDALTVRQERELGTDAARADTDRDGIEDGWEVQRRTNPLDNDTDGDNLVDRVELVNQSNPLSKDTDRDQMPDEDEATGNDCNGNGYPAIRDDDDDSDARKDVDEPATQRCQTDVDQDGVADGFERARVCITATDCDTDGLNDAYERNSTFSALNPDSFGVGLEDAILDAFQRRGQTPSADLDDDGIPDGWEGNDGLIDWGDFTPASGTRDLLIEFVRVSGPDSGRYASLSFTPAYDSVKSLFQRESNIRLQWIETPVTLSIEQRPTLIPSSYSAYYTDILGRAAHSANPYVTTVVMNPQHDQSELLHAGVAPIRGMLAAVDYGVDVTLRYRLGSQTLRMTPLVESAIEGNRLDLIQAFGWEQAGKRSNGEMFVDGPNYIIVWQPHWFRTVPRLITDDGDTLPMTFESATVDQANLAFTIAHELGHTLGLCHLDLPDCLVNITATDQVQASTSTMHPSGTSLHFLASEWQNAGRYMTCPPHGTVRLIANNATNDELIEEKYGYTLNEILDVGVRECGDFSKIADDLLPYSSPFRYDPPLGYEAPTLADNSTAFSALYAGATSMYTLAAALLAGLLTHRAIRRTRQAAPRP